MVLLTSIEAAHNYLWAYKILIILYTFLFVFANEKQSPLLNKQLTPIICLIIIVFITFRPEVWQYFGDTCNYSRSFHYAQQYGKAPDKYKDIGFVATINFFKNFNLRTWFLFFATLYVLPQYVACKKLFDKDATFAFVLVVGALSFSAYGFNGMRNGTACALVMWGIIHPSLIIKSVLFIVAISLHKSTMLPVCAYLVTFFYNDTKRYIYVWCICLVIAYSFSGILGNMQWLSDLIGDSRIDYLNKDFSSLENASKMNFSYTGFRWDFLIYSAIPIYWGWVTIVKEGIINEWYSRLFNIYLICNTVWLFTARVPFNNRFAYLSWFLMPLIIAYPFVLNESFKTTQKINYLVLAYMLLGFML